MLRPSRYRVGRSPVCGLDEPDLGVVRQRAADKLCTAHEDVCARGELKRLRAEVDDAKQALSPSGPAVRSLGPYRARAPGTARRPFDGLVRVYARRLFSASHSTVSCKISTSRPKVLA